MLDVAQAVPGFPVIASGGVTTGDDAVACLLAGATAVQVGTATLVDASAPVEVAKGVARYIKAKNLASPGDLTGRLRVPAAYAPPGADASIPAPSGPIAVALDVSDLGGGRRPRGAPRARGRIAEGRARARVGGRTGGRPRASAGTGRCSSTRSCTTSRRPSSVRARTWRGSASPMCTVHALGGAAMMRAARDGAARGAAEAGVDPPLVVAVTVLSSHAGEELASPASLAWEAKEAGIDGVVVSGEDVRDVRDVCGEGFCLVVPGIRPAGGNGHDQVRVLTPEAAIERGADYLVIGRPITDAADPLAATRAIRTAIG